MFPLSSPVVPRFAATRLSEVKLPAAARHELQYLEENAPPAHRLMDTHADAVYLKATNRLSYVEGMLKGAEILQSTDQKAAFAQRVFQMPSATPKLKELAICVANALPNQRLRRHLLTQFRQDPDLGYLAGDFLSGRMQRPTI